MSLGAILWFRPGSSLNFLRSIAARLAASTFLMLALFALSAATATAQANPQFIYGANTNTHMIYAFQLKPTTGVLTEIAGSPFNERLAPSAMAVNPAGTLLFVANGADNDVSVFQINVSTGALTEVANSPFSTGFGLNPTLLAVHPSGQFLYVINATNANPNIPEGEIDVYSIDATTGQLTPSPNSSPPNQGTNGPLDPVGVYIHPEGNWIYVAAGGFPQGVPVNMVEGLGINRATGDIGGYGIPIPEYTNEEQGTALAGDPAGGFLLSIWAGQSTCVYIDTLSINQITGAMTDTGSWNSIPYAEKLGGSCFTPVRSATIDATSTYLYTSIGYLLDATAPVTPIDLTIASDFGSGWVADPVGPFVFDLGINSYSINQATGALAAVPGSPFGATYGINVIAVTGSPAIPTSPKAGFSPANLTFSNTAIGVASPPQSLLFVNAGNASLTISNTSITGANSSDFAIQSNSCTNTLAAGANCTISVTFTPSITGSENASLTIADSAAGSPQSASLNRPGPAQTPAQAALNPTSLTFPQTSLGSTSTSNFTVTNSGTETLTFTGITIGGPNPNDFTVSDNCGSSIVGSGSCKVTITFQPQAAGQRTATVFVADNSYNGSPQSVPIAGTAVNPFGLAPSGPTGGTATPTTPAVYTVNFTPAATFSGTATFSCAIMPATSSQVGCTVSPTMLQVTASNSPSATPIIIKGIYEPNTASVPAHGFLPGAAQFLFGPGNGTTGILSILLLGLCGFAFLVGYSQPRTKSAQALMWRPRVRFIAISGFLAACLIMPACGGSNSGGSQPPPQSYTIQFTATAGTSTQTVNLSLTVQP